MKLLKKTVIGFVVFIVLLVIVIAATQPKKGAAADRLKSADKGFTYVDHAHDAQPVDPTPPPDPAPTPMTEEQKKTATDVIDRLQTEQVYGDVKLKGTTVFVTVLPKWYTLSFDDKKKFANSAVWWGKTTDLTTDSVIFNDSQTNHEAATFDKWGLTVK
jgi:hypothetical protein